MSQVVVDDEPSGQTRNLLITAQARRDLPPPVMRRAIRVAAGASLRDLGEAVGVTGQAVALWEQGERTPTGEHLLRYVEVLRSLDQEGNR